MTPFVSAATAVGGDVGAQVSSILYTNNQTINNQENKISDQYNNSLLIM